jgi:DNA-binding Xre family transcriptional regulator
MQLGKKFKYDPLAPLRKDVEVLIGKKFRTVEEFCWAKGISKSVLSRLLSGKQTEFHLETLIKISAALGKKVSIRLE